MILMHILTCVLCDKNFITCKLIEKLEKNFYNVKHKYKHAGLMQITMFAMH